MVELIPHSYQETSIERVRASDYLGLLADPGLGKTAMILEAFRRMRADLYVRRLLVVAPLRCCYSVWPAEVQKWRQFSDMRVRILHDANFETALNEDADVWVINYDALIHLAGGERAVRGEVRKYPNRWAKWRSRPEMVVLDESTRIKTASTDRSRRARRIGRDAAVRAILTGTPAPNGVQDLHGQLLFLDGGQRLGTSMEAFQQEYMVPIWNGHAFEWRPRPDAPLRVSEAIKDCVLRLDARDHLDLPALVVVERRFPLPQKARALYDKLRREALAEFEGGAIVAFNAGAKSAKLRQVASGTAYAQENGELSGERGKRIIAVHDAKLEALGDLVEELGGKNLFVAYAHRCDVPRIQEMLRKRFRIEAPAIMGGTGPEAGAKIADAWNRGEVRVLLAHPASAGHGLNLQAGGNHAAFFGGTWDLELQDQFIARLLRQGQEADRVFVHHLVAEKTIDEVLAAAMQQKSRNQETLLQWFREHALGREVSA